MVQEEKESEVIMISPLVKDLIDDIVKDIDYNSNSVDINCWKGVVLFVLNKVALADRKIHEK